MKKVWKGLKLGLGGIALLTEHDSCDLRRGHREIL